MKRTLFDPGHRSATIARLHALTPAAPRRWGTMNAPRMIAHLTDQMRHCLGDALCRPMPSALRLPGLKWLAIHVVPWPHGVKGPADAFVTVPGDWESDLALLVGLVERLAASSPGGEWPDHPKFGAMSGHDWGYFSAKHFDHHLRQFGV